MATVDLAVIGNGMFGALVDGRGRFVWCCLDTFDGDPVFNCLVNNNSDKTGFHDAVLEDFERAEQSYLGTSTVLVTELHTSRGDSVEIRDFAPRFHHFDRLFRPFQLVRRIRRVRGDPRITIRIRPTFQYNSMDGYQTRGSQHIRFCGPKQTWRVTTNTSVRHVIEELPFVVPVEPVYIIFGADESFTNSLQTVSNEFETQTVNYWKQWCSSLCLPVEFQELLVRAAMTLAVIQSEDCGGFLSSLTLGLPLGPLGGATRDTRVCRLLDECLALPVLRDIGLLDVCRKFLTFVKEVCFQQDKPQHTYNPWGSALSQKLEWAPYLAGYRGMGEVHSGGPLLEPWVEPGEGGEGAGSGEGGEQAGGAEDCGGPGGLADEWHSRTVVYCLLVVSLAHAFFDIRLSPELCTPKLFEKLELYALRACDGFGQMSQLHRARGPGPGGGSASAAATANGDGAAAAPPARRSSPRPPLGAGFFDDDPSCLLRQAAPRALGGAEEGFLEAGQPAVHSLTSVLCWAAADRLQRIAAHFRCDHERAQYWRRRALEMHEDICRHAWSSQRGAFTTYWGGSRVGPSMLRIAELGFISAEDIRFRGTVRAFEADAAQHAVHHAPGPADGHPPGASGVVGQAPAPDKAAVHALHSACFMTNTLLWYCEALRSTGSPAESRRLLEALVRCSAHRGLLAESVDLRTAELWGNAPSATALLSLLRVAPRLSRSWREV